MAAEWIHILWAALIGGKAGEPIPVMDGPLAPNTMLDDGIPLGARIDGAEDFAFDAGGGLYVTAGTEILRLDPSDPESRQRIATMPAAAGPIAAVAGGLAVGVSGHGVCLVEGRRVRQLNLPVRCPTAISAGPEGSLLLANGSERNTPERWVYDLMEHGASGSLLRLDPASGNVEMLRQGLAWPHGVVSRPAQGSILFSESWRHRVGRIRPGAGPHETELANLPGYPARIAATDDGGMWLSIFALRTQLVEFVLRERSYREDMVRTMDPALWIAPALATDGHYREPLQGGGIKKLGIQKPWAPPRSYGLVIRFDAEGEPVRSLHSRVGGRWHGVVKAQEHRGRLYFLSKGRGQLLSIPLQETSP